MRLSSCMPRRSKKMKELISRSSLETHKLDLMAEVSNLKLKLATSEKERKELEDSLLLAQQKIDDLQSRLNDRTIEVNELKLRLAKNGTIPSNLGNMNTEQTDSFNNKTLEREKTLDRLKRKHGEVERLKKAVESLMVTNDEKDRHIGELRKLLKRYKKIEEMVVTAQGRKVLESLGLDEEHSDSSSTHTSSSANDGHREHQQHLEMLEAEFQDARPNMPTPSATSTPVNNYAEAVRAAQGLPNGYQSLSPAPSTISPGGGSPTPKKSPCVARSNSCEDITPIPTKTPPTIKRKGETYSTLPTAVRVKADPKATHTLQPAHPPKKGFASFGKGFFKLRTGKWSSSAPNLAQTETDEEALKDEMAQQYKAMQNTSGEPKKKKGIKRFFGRLRRSSSQDLDEERLDDFKRSGLRATAGPRLGWSRDLKSSDLDVPFARWDSDRVAAWLHNLGLSMYVGECKRWVRNGDQLLRANTHDLEKEMGIRNHFHRKKLQLALQAIGSEANDKLEDLDHNWVTRWLDDIGLPQYKDTFGDARIDGRMLHYLTVEDLMGLKVTNELHHLSIKRGIQALRMNNFNPGCLKRRPAPEEGHLNNCPQEVFLWTNHRVMEWLRTIDLSEYAPNLRGSGVHGALMVLEPRFSSEIFAGLLSIPPTKTLLRRHLHTHFVMLIGNSTQHRKREYEASPQYQPLTPNTKIKAQRRFGLFAHKRSRSDPGMDDLICPMDLENPILDKNGTAIWRPDGKATKQEKEKAEKAAKEIGAYSQEIHTLTRMLAKDKFLDDVPTSNV